MTSSKESGDVFGHLLEEKPLRPSRKESKDLSELPPSGTSLHKRRRGEPPATLSVKSPQTPSDAEGSSPCTAGPTPEDTWAMPDGDTTDPEALCESMLQRLKDRDDPLSKRGKDVASRTKDTLESLDQLEKLLELLDQFVTLKEHNARLLKRLRDVNHLKRLHSAHKRLDHENEKLKDETKELELINEALDAELECEYGQAIFDSMVSGGRSMKRTGSKWKSHTRFGGSLLRKQRSRSAGGDESDVCPGTPLRRRSDGIFCKEVEKSKVSNWTRVKAAFKWEKAQWPASTLGGAAAVAAGAMVGAVALAGSTPGTLPNPEPRDSASLTPGSAISLTPNSSCEELRIESGTCRRSGMRSEETDNIYLHAPIQDDSSTSPSPNKLHKSPWVKMRDIIQTHRESVKRKTRVSKGSPDVVPSRRRSFSDGADSDAPPALTLTIPSSEELESEGSHPVLRKQRSLELGARPPQHRTPRDSKWTVFPHTQFAALNKFINISCILQKIKHTQPGTSNEARMDKDRALEEMMGKLGDFGRYQGLQFFLHILSALTAGLHMLSLVTVAAVPEHRCWIDGVDTNDTAASWNSSALLESIPLTASGGLSSCLMYNEDNETVACNRWVYDSRYTTSSRAIEWDLVCDQRWRGALAQTIYMLGVFTGAVYLGGLADKIGRKKVFCLSGVLQLILGVIVAFIPEYWSFVVVTYLYAIFGSAGAYIPAFVLTMELVGPSKRTICGVAFQATFALGIMLVAGWGALINNNRVILQVLYGLHGLLLLPHIWIMDESPRWLWAQGRPKEAVDIVQKALKCNKSDEVLDRATLVSKGKVETSRNSEPSAGVSDLFKTPNLRIKTLNVCLSWFANSLVYYGLTLSTGKLEGNPYLITAVFGLVELPSYAAVVYFLDIWGRRPLISSMMLVGGGACIIAAFLPQGSIISTVIVIGGKLFIAGSFAIVYNYSAELFPTVVRNSAIGLGSMCARFSGALTPLITLLDSFDPKIPAATFGLVAVVSGFLCCFLPETMNQPMPQSLADGENFGKGETCFTSCLGKRNKADTYNVEDKAEEMVSLDDMSKKV